jgi:hypothetical protein
MEEYEYQIIFFVVKSSCPVNKLWDRSIIIFEKEKFLINLIRNCVNFGLLLRNNPIEGIGVFNG